jgi:hypothetical protein
MPANDWTHERPCCVMTWSTLVLLGQMSRPFLDSAELPMKRLGFWAGSQTGREARARALAVMIDSTFRDLFGSKYEDGVRKTDAILGMTAMLLADGGEHTLAGLANGDDQLYLFLGEER